MNDSKKNTLVRMYKLLSLALIISLPGTVSGEDKPYRDYSDWYQVEVIVFSPLKGADFGESWPLLEKNYPANLVNISAASPDDIKPQNLTQLNQLRELEFLMQSANMENGELQVVERQEEFMFGNRSLHNQPAVVVQPDVQQDPDLQADGLDPVTTSAGDDTS